MGQIFSEVFPPKPHWLPKDMPDLTGKVIIITGGNAGIGRAMSKYLLLKNCTLYLFCRSTSKAQAAIAELKAETGKEAHFISCDLSDLQSIKACVSAFLAKEQRLDVLYNNAGIAATPVDEITKQGYDMQFGTNVLGHACLTFLLLPLLQSTAKTHGSARVITTSSNAHLNVPNGGFDYATLKDGPVRWKKYNPMMGYFQSKWGNLVFAMELARRYGNTGIVSITLNPGIIGTDGSRNVPALQRWIANLLSNPADPLGAITPLYAGTAPEAASMNGKYFIPWARPGMPRKDTEDPAAGKALWEWLEEQVQDI